MGKGREKCFKKPLKINGEGTFRRRALDIMSDDTELGRDAMEEDVAAGEVASEEPEDAAIGGGGGGGDDLLKEAEEEAEAEEEGEGEGGGVGCIQEYKTLEDQEGYNFRGTFVAEGLDGTIMMLASEDSMGLNVFSKARLGPNNGKDAVVLALGWKVFIGSTWFAYTYCYEKADTTVRYNNNK
jgi:hypothetical protein